MLRLALFVQRKKNRSWEKKRVWRRVCVLSCSLTMHTGCVLCFPADQVSTLSDWYPVTCLVINFSPFPIDRVRVTKLWASRICPHSLLMFIFCAYKFAMDRRHYQVAFLTCPFPGRSINTTHNTFTAFNSPVSFSPRGVKIKTGLSVVIIRDYKHNVMSL